MTQAIDDSRPHFCRSFKPLVSRASRVLILGSMPGPEALRKQQYYGFAGNHFWKLLPVLFNEAPPANYNEKIRLVKRHRLALWDVIGTCVRPGALDSSIRSLLPNDIPGLLKRYPGIRAVFINGQFAHKTFLKHFENQVSVPVHILPSTSPANAMMSVAEKTKRWSAILKFL
jgi:TDG/mug DNA glycosylase family protein